MHAAKKQDLPQIDPDKPPGRVCGRRMPASVWQKKSRIYGCLTSSWSRIHHVGSSKLGSGIRMFFSQASSGVMVNHVWSSRGISGFHRHLSHARKIGYWLLGLGNNSTCSQAKVDGKQWNQWNRLEASTFPWASRQYHPHHQCSTWSKVQRGSQWSTWHSEAHFHHPSLSDSSFWQTKSGPWGWRCGSQLPAQKLAAWKWLIQFLWQGPILSQPNPNEPCWAHECHPRSPSRPQLCWSDLRHEVSAFFRLATGFLAILHAPMVSQE